MSARRVQSWRGLLCAAEPNHGVVLGIVMPDGSTGWHCPHSGHCPRPKTHPQGAAAQTRSIFTLAEVEAGAVAA